MSALEKTDSIFDVLYSDTRRLSSLLSQFSEDGLVTEVTSAAGTTSSRELSLSAKVLKSDSTQSGTQNTSRRIDPQWLLPLLFLDKAKDIIQRDIAQASIGALVLVTGRLIVTDLSVLQEMWKSPAMKRQILRAMVPEEPEHQNRHERRSAAKQPKKDTTEQEAILEMLPLMPHLAQANILTPDHAVWSTIRPDSLVGSMADIMLKHGAKVAGSWSMVGILDARPWEEREDEDYDEIINLNERIRLGMFVDNVWKVATELAFPIRQALGRPLGSYGVTPLIIFREIET